MKSFQVKAFTKGKPHFIDATYVDGHILEVQLAKAFKVMREAANADGVDLVITSGFRTMEQQTKLFEARKDPKASASLGTAAAPGFSRHQNGKAIDVRTGISKPGFIAGKSSPVWEWIKTNAPLYGFEILRVLDEPWHLEFEPRT